MSDAPDNPGIGDTSGGVTVGAWRAPTAEALEEHLRRHPPRPPSPWLRRVPLIVLVAAAVVAVGLPAPEGFLVSMAMVAAVLGWGSRRVKALQRFERRVNRAQELAMLRHHRTALRSAWRLIAELPAHPPLQHRAVAVLSHCLDDLGAHEAAVVAYDRLLDDLPAGHPGAVLLRVQKAIAALHGDRLADADDALRRLRGGIEPLRDTPIGAAFGYATLLQSVRTAHYAEAIEESAGLLDTLRPLGVEAAFGHALLAFCHHQRDDDTARDAAQAVTWWERATALIPAESLLRRLPELRVLKEPRDG